MERYSLSQGQEVRLLLANAAAVPFETFTKKAQGSTDDFGRSISFKKAKVVD